MKWVNRKEIAKDDILAMSRKHNIIPELSAILLKRGIDDVEEFLHPSTKCLYDARIIKDMDKGCSLIADAIKNNVKIAIVNDYDIDGITSGQIMLEALTYLYNMVNCDNQDDLTSKPKVYTPDRIIDGYGLSRRLVDLSYADGCRLIVTTDNGISALDSIDYAKSLGFTVVVTDHHDIPFIYDENNKKQYTLPIADAIINVKQKGDKYPFKEICGASVSYKVAGCLLDDFKVDKKERVKLLTRWGELLSFGTVCDVMPLVDENRMYVSAGIKLIRQGSRYVSLRQLMSVNNIKAESFNSDSFGFSLGPCLNAVGRMTGSVDMCMDFIAEKDQTRAYKLAENITRINYKRKDICDKAYKDALKIIEQEGEKDIYVLYIPDVLESLCGVVAGRLKEVFNKPVIVCSDSENGYLKGSGRSIKGYHLFDNLSKYKELFIAVGGHELALGLSITKDNFFKLKELLENDIKKVDRQIFDKASEKLVDLFMGIEYVSDKFVEALELFEPCGTDNPSPVLCDENVEVVSLKSLGSGTTLKLTLRKGNKEFEGITFNNAEKIKDMIKSAYGKEDLDNLFLGRVNGIYLDFLYTPKFNIWNGVKKVQFNISDFRLPISK